MMDRCAIQCRQWTSYQHTWDPQIAPGGEVSSSLIIKRVLSLLQRSRFVFAKKIKNKLKKNKVKINTLDRMYEGWHFKWLKKPNVILLDFVLFGKVIFYFFSTNPKLIWQQPKKKLWKILFCLGCQLFVGFFFGGVMRWEG